MSNGLDFAKGNIELVLDPELNSEGAGLGRALNLGLGSGVLVLDIQTPSTSIPCSSALMPKGTSSASIILDSISCLGSPPGP
jgi:hypothetical protein